MISAAAFVEAARQRGFGLFSGVPCSYLKPFINYTIGAEGITYVGATNEGDAVAIAAGARLGGVGSVAMFQNSGLGNAVSPLTSLTYTFRIPCLLIPTLRGDPDGDSDESQHELMGQITTRLLELMEIPWAWFPTQEHEIDSSLDRAVGHMSAKGTPYALVMRKGSVEPAAIDADAVVKTHHTSSAESMPARVSRTNMLAAIQLAAGPGDVVIASTGFTGRELYALDDRPSQLYMVGSMGCAASLGLGLAHARPDRRVIVIDGDGAALMRLGALATVGYERPSNLVHVLLDNGAHESTGGQATVSPSLDFCAIAAACGFPTVQRVNDPQVMTHLLTGSPEGPQFLHTPILPGIPEDLPRPAISPAEVARRFADYLDAN
jgi:phosphonopyruvate decarboxylase